MSEIRRNSFAPEGSSVLSRSSQCTTYDPGSKSERMVRRLLSIAVRGP